MDLSSHGGGLGEWIIRSAAASAAGLKIADGQIADAQIRVARFGRGARWRMIAGSNRTIAIDPAFERYPIPFPVAA